MLTRIHRFLSVLVLTIILSILASCNNDSICYENIKWDLVGQFNEKEFGADQQAIPYLCASSSDNLSFTVYFLGNCDLRDRVGKHSKIMDAFLKGFKESFNNNYSVIFDTKEYTNYAEGTAQVIRREWEITDISIRGIDELVLIDGKLFLTHAVYPYDASDIRSRAKKRIKKISESIHIVPDSEDNVDTVELEQATPSKRRVLELCTYIPDHGLNPRAKDYMTSDFYSALSNAFAYDRRHSDGGIGPGEFLYYFVTGNGGSKPYFEVLSVHATETNHAVATIGVKELWGDQVIPDPNAEQRVYIMQLVYKNGEWLMDDFDNKKKECKQLIR